MRSLLADVVLFQAVTIPFVVIALLLARNRRSRYAIVFLTLFALDIIVLFAPSAFGFHPEWLEWNWIGKFLSVAWAALFIWLGPLSPKDVGITLRQRPGTMMPAIRISVILVLVTGTLLFVSDGVEPPGLTVETLVYQATMPGIAEEIIFRGVFLSVLILALGGVLHRDEFEWTRATIGAVLITTIVFGFGHGLSTDGGIQFGIEAFVFSATPGGIFAWLRMYTGSLLFPILLHNAVNLLPLFLLIAQ